MRNKTWRKSPEGSHLANKLFSQEFSIKNIVLLLFPKTGINPLQPQPPLALLSLAPYLEALGLKPIIVDQRVEPDYADTIRNLLPQALFVGITSMTGEQIRYAVELIALVKSCSPSMPVVFGGAHASLLPEQVIQTEGIDVVVVGEGEGVIADLALCFQRRMELADVQGIYFKRENGIFSTPARDLLDMEDCLPPSWDLIDTGRYTDFTIQAGRGCPYSCTYCYNMKYNRGIWRFRSPEAIVNEIKYLSVTKGITEFFFVDDNFFSSFDRVERICNLIIWSGLRITWKATCRADYFSKFSPFFIELLKKSGVAQLFVGGESGSPGVLKRINKKITVEDILTTAHISREYDLPTSISFMTGFPFETEQDRKLTLGVMDRIKAIHPAISMDGINIYTPYPGNELYEESKKYGLIEPASLPEWSLYVFNLGNLPWFSKSHNRMLENLSFISRFCFWQGAIKERFLKRRYYPFYCFLRLSALVRWRWRAFCYAFEWDVFRLIRRKYL